MKKENDIYLISIIFLVVFMALFFPIVGPDVTWKLIRIDSLKSFLNIKNEGIITSAVLTLFANFNSVRILGTGLLIATLLGTIKATVNKKNTSLILLSGCLFLLLDRTFFASSVATFSGLTKYLIDSLLLLTFINVLIKNAIPKLNKLALFIFGLVLVSLNLSTALIVSIVSLIYTAYIIKEKEDYVNSLVLLFGCLLGLGYSFYRHDISILGFSTRLIHEFVPALSGTNFLIVLLFSGLAMFQIPKMCTGMGDKWAIPSLLGMSFYLFSSLLIKNDVINYLAYIGYFISSFHVLYNFTNSKAIKRKVFIIYAFKLLFILATCIKPFELGSTLFIYLLDIVLVALCYDYIWPTRFLEPLWGGLLLVFLLSNIYVYRSVYYKNIDMNAYIKNRLECNRGQVLVPSYYQNPYLYKSIPTNDVEIRDYLKYYDIDVYDKDNVIEILFKE